MLISCVGGSWGAGRARAWQVVLRDEGGMLTTQNAPCSLQKSAFGM